MLEDFREKIEEKLGTMGALMEISTPDYDRNKKL